jgi:signal transduction histidine kinase/DNA-binding response OmpR family regulator
MTVRSAGLLLLAILFVTFSAGTFAAETAPFTDAVDLAKLPEHVQLVQQLSVLEDKSGQLDVEAALASPDWRPATPTSLNRGFNASAFWLEGSLYNSSNKAVTRWLSVGAVRLEDIRYFRLASDSDKPLETLRAGISRPLDERPVRAALSIFPVTLAPGEQIRFALRIESRSSVSMNVDVWTPRAFRENQERGSMGEMLLAGSMLTIALYTLLLGFAHRDRVFLLLAGSIITDVIYDLAFRGYLYRYVLTGGGEWILRAPSVVPALTAAMFSAMAVAFAELWRIRYWKWIYRVLICTLCLFSAWTAFGDYRTSANFALDSIFVCNAIWIVSMLDGWRRGHANARLFILAFAIDCATLFLRLLSLRGVLPGSWGTGFAWDNLSILLMMVLIVTGRSRQLERDQRRAQQALLDARARDQERLERAVGERTYELQAALIAADEASNAKTDFLARVSHDLRTPLTSIIGFADLVQAGGREDAERGSIIRRSATHMLNMVNDLIDYAAGADPSALCPAPVYTHGLINSISHEATSLATKYGNRFVLDVRSEVAPILELDEKRVRQVIGNLIDNAIKFTTSGTVTLSVTCREGVAEGTPVNLVVSVKDTGCGIAPEEQQRIFEPFHRLDAARSQPGIGLGLAIVKHWVSQMGGALNIESAPGAGTTVTVSIPSRAIAEADVAQHYISDAFGALPSIDGTGLRIWIAEDTEEVRQFLADELSNLGFDVETASDGAALIERIFAQPHGSTPDIVLTDHMMPRAGGTAVLAAVRHHLPSIPVVAISATPQTVRGAGDDDVAGYDACLLKPVNLAELRNTLARLLGLAREAPVEPTGNDQPLVRPSTQALAQAQQLIQLGAVSDLIDWADNLASRDQRCTAFALKVQQLARLGDLGELQVLFQA